jgi:hypothetical protein
MGRPPLSDKPMTATERKRKYRQRNATIADQVQRIVYIFSAQSAEAQSAFVAWLRKTRRLK